MDDAGVRGGERIRTRLVVWTLLAVAVAVLLLGAPLAVIARQWIYSQELTLLQRQAESVADLLDDPRMIEQLPTAVALAALTLNARLSVLDTDGAVLRDSAGVAPGTAFDDPAVAAARRSGADARLRAGAMVAAVRTEIGGADVIVRLARPDDTAVARAGNALLAIAAVAGTALAAGAALGAWRARQLAEPLEALAQSASRLGEGDFSEQAPRSGVLEIDRIAGALDATAGRLRSALQRSASFAADASHQLRTPLTALRLDLEALQAEIGERHPMLEAAEAEIDRLETTITELLELADAGTERHVVDVRALALERIGAWRTLADAAGRAVRVTREPVPPVRARAGAVGQALQVLLDNAVIHGRGDITIWLESVTRGDRSWVRLCVGDEGEGVRPEHLERPVAGRGLALARSLVEAEGGRVVVDRGQVNRVCLLLPCADGEPSQGDGSRPDVGSPPDDGSARDVGSRSDDGSPPDAPRA